LRENFFLYYTLEVLFLLGMVPLLIFRRKGGKVVTEENTLIFFVDEKAKITSSGKDMPFAELKKGMRVSIKYKKHRDKRIAVRIKVLTNSAREL